MSSVGERERQLAIKIVILEDKVMFLERIIELVDEHFDHYLRGNLTAEGWKDIKNK